ncbi:MAG: ROK family protein [Alphaproteobacteria bacterium]|nr:ROK family protein [Alphaproteobacteria bacterium]
MASGGLCRIGVDLGGTKIEAIALAPDGRERVRRRIATPQGDYPGTIRATAQLVEAIAREVACAEPVGVGIPGTVLPQSGLVKNANSICLIGHRLDADLAAAMGRPVRLTNDANCLALSEAVDGAGRHAGVVFAAILGTGCGSGIAVNHRLLSGPNSIAGEWGHNPLPWTSDDEWPGRLYYCGKRGCIETFLSGPALSRDHAEQTGETLPAESIAARVQAGDGAARLTLDRHVERVAKALARVLNLLDPDIVVLGGGLSNLDYLYDEVPRRWGRYAFSDVVVTPLVRAAHGDSSGVRGAAWLWPLGG